MLVGQTKPATDPGTAIMLKIFLLAYVVHEHFLTDEYQYFFDPAILKGSTFGRFPRKSVEARYEYFSGLSVLWQQYQAIRQIAEHHGIAIFNATAAAHSTNFLV